MSNPPTTRPYTSYNLFFQLEREYILQTLLGFQPTIASKDIFDPADKTYPAEGPPLPSRYKNIIMPHDWHTSGKNRQKRSHRKSHGKIGFGELSKQISKAWSMADDEIRKFCTCLSDIEWRKYKKDKRKMTHKEEVTRKRNKGKTTVTSLINTEPKDDDCNDLSPSFDWSVNIPQVFQDEFTIDSPFLTDNNVSLREVCRRIVYRESAGVEHEDLHRASSYREPFTEVDMEDGEIIDIWKTTHIEDNTPSILSTCCQMCKEIVNPNATITPQRKMRRKSI